ncbi:hypothetical protein C6369_001915 [Rhodococcus rhodochrous]|uniref:hypothetical protein n=1 Tax=Rhodococcus rhodochrous TaxID=1829 RepID=UPI000D0628DC|nr:hypothetical protein [Rhodococcus rhodochrous]AYA23417.1 hypothetical protein C6369_001915 [Rhodococcus rhodochrous]
MHYLPDGEHRHRLLAALRAVGLEVEELWLRYFALGGEVGKVEIEAYLSGLLPLPALQHDLIAHAINERLDELAPPRAPYAAELPLPLREGNGAHENDDAVEDTSCDLHEDSGAHDLDDRPGDTGGEGTGPVQ